MLDENNKQNNKRNAFQRVAYGLQKIPLLISETMWKQSCHDWSARQPGQEKP